MVITGLILIAGTSLAACQKKAVGDVADFGVTGSASARPEDQFGKGFGKAFRAPSNAEPANVSENDVTLVSRTAEPAQVN